MTKKAIITTIICLVGIISQVCFANTARNCDNFIPSGLHLSGVLAQDLNSNSTTIGQTVSFYLLENFKYGDILIAPKTSMVSGIVVKNKKATENSNAYTLIRFTSIRTPYNNMIPISALIETEDKTGILKGDKDVILKADSTISIIFDQPITVVAQ